jgi:hypothetical protein
MGQSIMLAVGSLTENRATPSWPGTAQRGARTWAQHAGAVATILVLGDYETMTVVLVLAAFGVAIWYQVRKGQKKSAVKLALWLAFLIVLWWFGTGPGATPPQH